MTGKQVEGRWFQMTNRRLDMFVGKMERLDAERQDGWDGMEWNGMECKDGLPKASKRSHGVKYNRIIV